MLIYANLSLLHMWKQHHSSVLFVIIALHAFHTIPTVSNYGLLDLNCQM